MSDLYDTHDTEITLGTGRLLGLFFGLVVVCAVFFGLGYTLGRNSTAPGGATIVQGAANVPVTVTAGGTKPAAVKQPTEAPIVVCAAGQSCDEKSAAQPAAAEPPAVDAHDARSAAMVGMKVAPAPELARSGTPQSGFVVQIAAVSRKDDADALIGALRKKNYPVFVLADAGDRLFHIQVGPFSDRTEAQKMKDRLAGDGYNAIVK